MSAFLDRFSYIPGFADEYGRVVDRVESAGEQASAHVEHELRKLMRADGSPVFGPAEHRERVAAIVNAARDQFDAAAAPFLRFAEGDVADRRRQLAALGSDPLDSLTPDEQVRAAARREFVREDVERLSPGDLAGRIHAAIAADDKVTTTLYARYAADRDDVSRAPLNAAVRALRSFLGDDERFKKRSALEEQIRAAQALPLAVADARQSIGSQTVAVPQYARL